MEQYKTALEHISVRAGTAIPTGAAEGALAVLYQRREEAWPFLAEHLTADDLDKKGEGTPPESGAQANGADDRKGDVDGEGEPQAGSEVDDTTTATTERTAQRRQRTGRPREQRRSSSITSTDEAAPEPFTLARLSVALEEFACACEERGDPLEGLAVQGLMKFLYLGGQAKVGFPYLEKACDLGTSSILKMSNKRQGVRLLVRLPWREALLAGRKEYYIPPLSFQANASPST